LSVTYAFRGRASTVGYNLPVSSRRLYQVGAERRETIVQALARALAEDMRVSYGYVHGSFVDGPAFHDIDVAVSLASGGTSPTNVLLDLSESLSNRVGLPVDVRALDEAPLAFRFHAMRGRLLFSRNDERLTRAIEETARRYLDLEPILRVATREAFAS